jgi:acetyl-CoA/propionyl-CoA carboxylase, biotin carboxylase, biotin carboxyl carrier protein
MQSVLIANRGEIAIRVIRAARELGLRTIAVYSDLDRDGLHPLLADEAWHVGPAPATESYLAIDRILEAARNSGAEAVHPGYGFLAENAGFAQAVLDAGLVWVGPPPDAIRSMGDKIASRRAAAAAGVEPVPGTTEPLTSLEGLQAVAADLGYPLAIKAAHGGGGKGLKVVRAADGLEAAYESAGREAAAWFANPEVYVEKYIDRPRHIEAQVLFDRHGNGVFLGERDCSVQRRHQKLIEETPATNFTEEQRTALGEAAVAVAAATGYENAGTVEFLVDPSGAFYFLEMNTRIQVEHTITEMVTGIDLVQSQLRVAAGEPLPVTATPRPFGHAIEFRINAEDPSRNFLPNPGTVVEYREPGGFGVRVDSGIVAGSVISQYYDNLIAKLVVWGRDREEAIRRSRRALSDFVITGVATTIPAHQAVLATDVFAAGRHHSRYVEEELDLSGLTRPAPVAAPGGDGPVPRDLTVEVGGKRFEVRLWAPAPDPDAVAAAAPRSVARPRPPRREREQAAAAGAPGAAGTVVAPMQGTIVKVHKAAGSTVAAGEALCVLEAMKMENEIRAPVAGELAEVRVAPGDTVAAGAVLMVVR